MHSRLDDAAAPRPIPAWAHRSGLIDMNRLEPADWGPEAIEARSRINEAFYRFGMGHDERRADVAASCFTEDTVYEVGLGSAEPFAHWYGRAEVEARLAAIAEELGDQRRHLISNVLVEELDLRRGIAYALAYGFVAVASSGLSLVATTLYRGSLRREADGCWRFDRFFIGMDDLAGPRPESGEDERTISENA